MLDKISHSLANYLFKYGPLSELVSKYKINHQDLEKLTQYTTNRIAGLFLLYVSKDTKRINDILNKYYRKEVGEVTPEVEGYIEK